MSTNGVLAHSLCSRTYLYAPLTECPAAVLDEHFEHPDKANKANQFINQKEE